MKFTLPGLFVVAFTAAALSGCSRQSAAPPATESGPTSAAEPDSHAKRGTNGAVVVTVDAQTQKTMGLETTPLSAMQLRPQVTGFGHVLDPAPLVSVVADITSAQAQAAASEAELKRVRELAVQDNASQRALQAAEAAAARDAALLNVARSRLLAGWGALAGQKDLSGFVQSLVSLKSALLQINLPAGEATNTPVAARVVPLAGTGNPIEPVFLGQTTSVDPQLQGRGFLYLVSSNDSRLLPGAAVTGYLEMPGTARSGVLLPRNAVLRFSGAAWIYVQTGGDTFQRTEVQLNDPVDGGWFVTQQLHPGDKVVVTGAQELLSEELKGSAE